MSQLRSLWVMISDFFSRPVLSESSMFSKIIAASFIDLFHNSERHTKSTERGGQGLSIAIARAASVTCSSDFQH